MALTPRTAELTRILKQTFREWDQNGDGIISKEELVAVLSELGRFKPEDLELVVQEVDRNGNGVIEYDEFVDWVTRPSAAVQVAHGKVKPLDPEEVFRPLFTVYDRNASGHITLAEMRSCHQALEEALKSVDAEDGELGLPSHSWSTIHRATVQFRIADVDHNEKLSFQEFVAWQRKATAHCGLTGDEVAKTSRELAELLGRVLRMQASSPNGHKRRIPKKDLLELQRLQERLYQCQRKLWSRCSGSSLKDNGACAGYASTWCPPPRGMSIRRLRQQHLSAPRLTAAGPIDRIEVHVPLCLPEADAASPAAPHRRWVAQVLQRAFYTSGVEQDSVHHYAHNGQAWTELDGCAEFDAAVLDLAPSLRLYCLLLMRADFGPSLLSWNTVQEALDAAVAMSLLSAEQRGKYEHFMHEVAQEVLEADGFASADPASRAALVEEFLQGQLTLSPIDVMGELCNLGIAPRFTLWNQEGR